MVNKKTDIAELFEKVLIGLRKALRKLVENSAAKNETLVIADKEGNIKTFLPKSYFLLFKIIDVLKRRLLVPNS
jgi:hypothetical protein